MTTAERPNLIGHFFGTACLCALLAGCASSAPRMTVVTTSRPPARDAAPATLIPSRSVTPVHPAPLLRLGVQGNALLHLVVTARGHVDSSLSRVLTATNPGFVAASWRAAAMLRFHPAHAYGRAVADSLTVRFSYAVAYCPNPLSPPATTWFLDSIPAVIETRTCVRPPGWNTTEAARRATRTAPMERVIREETARLGLRDLRNGLAAGEAEVRIWAGFGLSGIHLFRATRTGATWTTLEYSNVYNVPNPIPRPWISGACWSTRWTSKASRTFFKIPASPFYPHGQPIIWDGGGVVVEAADGPRYHVAGVMNVGGGNSPDDRQLYSFAAMLLAPATGC